MTLQQHALKTALADARLYREALFAALDQLHAAHLREQRLREQLAEQRETWARFAKSAFPEGHSELR